MLSVDCRYLKDKDKSFYTLNTAEYGLLKFRVSFHKCDKSLLSSESITTFEAYYVGGTAFEVKIGPYTLVDFKSRKSRNNIVFAAIIFLMVMAFLYVQLLFMGIIPLTKKIKE